MTVYIVMWERGYEDRAIVAAFLDEQKAIDYAEAKDREIRGPSWSAGSHFIHEQEVTE